MRYKETITGEPEIISKIIEELTELHIPVNPYGTTATRVVTEKITFAKHTKVRDIVLKYTADCLWVYEKISTSGIKCIRIETDTQTDVEKFRKIASQMGLRFTVERMEKR